MRARDNAPTVGAGRAEPEHHAIAGKSTLAEHAPVPSAKRTKNTDGVAERLAKLGEEVLDKIAGKVLDDLKQLTEYSPREADAAKEYLVRIAATCGPSSVSLQRQVRAAAHKIGQFHFAKLLRKALELARDMAGACHDLHENFDEDGIGALFKFIGAAMGTAKSWVGAIDDHAKAIHEVDELLVKIGARCGERPQVEVPAQIKPLIKPLPRVSLELEKRLAEQLGHHDLQLPGIQLPGQHLVIPKPILEVRGPVIVMAL